MATKWLLAAPVAGGGGGGYRSRRGRGGISWWALPPKQPSKT